MKGGDTALDYGCGRGRDADHFGMERFDPYFFPFAPRRRFDIITCIYVLNVVGKKTGTGIVKSIQGLLRRDGAAYIAVRNDVEKDTKSQRRVRLSTNNRHLDIPIHVCRGFAVYKVHKNDRVEVS
jgi:ABC-type molybdate transport system ATPase subunit